MSAVGDTTYRRIVPSEDTVRWVCTVEDCEHTADAHLYDPPRCPLHGEEMEAGE